VLVIEKPLYFAFKLRLLIHFFSSGKNQFLKNNFYPVINIKQYFIVCQMALPDGIDN
jgi:hypothetical protein